MEGKKKEIEKFYGQIFSDAKLRTKVEEKAKKIANEGDLRKLLNQDIMPLMKKHNVDFSEEELLDFEEESLRELSKKDLSNVSGGISIKSSLLGGGILSMALLGGISLSANAAPLSVTQNENVSATQNVKYTPFKRTTGFKKY